MNVALAVVLLLTPGCLIGSPAAAISGEPYGMTVDDVQALGGRRGRIWTDAPVFAAIDLPFAAVLDTAFLPISLIIWLIIAAGSDDEDDEVPERRRREHRHEQGDGHGHEH